MVDEDDNEEKQLKVVGVRAFKGYWDGETSVILSLNDGSETEVVLTEQNIRDIVESYVKENMTAFSMEQLVTALFRGVTS